MKAWRVYERAMFNELYYEFRPPRFVVKPDVREIIGKHSQEKRQIDVAVFDTRNMSHPLLAVESKRYSRKLNVKDVEAFVGMLADIGAQRGILVCPLGFSEGARRMAHAFDIVTRTLSLENAERLNWREVTRTVFPWDEAFHPTMGDAYHAFASSEQIWEWIDALQELPFEEWEAMVFSYQQIDQGKCEKMLRVIAQLHPDGDWRFNAIRLLDELGFLEESIREVLLQSESDIDVRELLEGPLGTR